MNLSLIFSGFNEAIPPLHSITKIRTPLIKRTPSKTSEFDRNKFCIMNLQIFFLFCPLDEKLYRDLCPTAHAAVAVPSFIIESECSAILST